MKPIRIAWRRGGYQSASKAGHTASLFSTLRQEKSGGTHPAADVLYKNPEAIANRLNLFHMLRLQVQARIDCPALQQISSENTLQITSKWHNGLPGCEKQYDPSESEVLIRVPLKALNLDSIQMARFRALLEAGAMPCSEHFATVAVKRYPFRAQNQKVALQILADLVEECRTATWQVEDKPEDLGKGMESVPVKKAKLKPSLKFPAEWLHPQPVEATTVKDSIGK